MSAKAPDLATIVTQFRSLRGKHAKSVKAKSAASAAGATTYHADKDAELLRTALGGAVMLEFATLPPYLSAIWSFKNDLHPVAKSLRRILQEEMLHMALVCNMLVAIGGRPAINTAAPVYPGKLPLNVHPELTVPLGGFSPAALAVFMEIERPKHPGHMISLAAANKLMGHVVPGDNDDDLTIGQMYDELLQSFMRQRPEMSTDHQITGPLAWMVVRHVDEVARAIGIIQRQGEGSSGPMDTGADDLAHYYRFAEMAERKKLEQAEAGGPFEFKTPIDLDYARDVWPVGTVPAGGWRDEQMPNPDVRHLVRSFNLTYSKLLDLLQAAWDTRGGQASFLHAIETMFALEKYAKPLMQMPRPDGEGNYAPDFRYIPRDKR